MFVRRARVLSLTALVAAGCGRIGVETLPLDAGSRDATVEAPDTPSEPDATEPNGDAPMLDATEHDANGSAGALDASVLEAALDAAPPSDASDAECVMIRAGGELASYRLGELAALDGTHMFALMETEQCAGPAACSVALGGAVQQLPCSLSPCQMWESTDAGTGWFTLRNALSGACLYMSGPDDDTAALSWECIDSDRVRWQVACAGANTWRLVNKLSQKALAGTGSTPGDVSIVQTAADSPGARWRITSNPKAYDVVIATSDRDPLAEWRTTTLRPSANWAEPSFDDAAWSSAKGAFGDMPRSDTPIGTAWTSPDIWLRRSFTLASIPAQLTLRIFHDEDAEVYLDGVQIAALTGWSQGYRSVEIPTQIRSTLAMGTHMLAVHCRNFSPPQIIDVGLISYTWR